MSSNMKLDSLDTTEKRLEAESKLESELNKLATLKENVHKSNQITKGMVNILSTFEQRLARLEETILPVYNETGSLQRCQQNIERALGALEHTISYYSIAEEVDGTIRGGPSVMGLDDYLSAMNKLRNAMNYFEKNNPQSVELENVSSLFNTGCETLTREFKNLLHNHSRPVAPITLLDLVATDDDISGDDISVGSVGGLNEGVTSELGTMATWLISHEKDDIIQIYSKVRSNVMTKSITQLREQQKSSSGGSVNALAPSPTLRPKFQSRHENPGRRASRRLQAAFEKKANKMLLKASQTIENSTGLNLGSRRNMSIHLEGREDIVDEQEMDGYLVSVMAVQRLMQMERNLMTSIFPHIHHNKVFQGIVQESLNIIVQDGDNIATRAKRCIGRHEFGSVLVVLPILKSLSALKPEFDRTVEGCDYTTRYQFTTIINTLSSTVAKGLEEVVESLRTDTSCGLPKDGTVHELTSNMLVLVSNLIEYKETIAKVLGQDSTYTSALVMLPKAQSEDREAALLSIYIKKVLSQLNCSLVSKSEGYPEVGVRAVFRLNNCHHVLKALQRSPSLLSILSISERDCQQTYIDMISTHKKAYEQSWNKVLSHISTDDIITLSGGKMRDKDRNLIKERFAGFNKEMEDISKQQRGYSIPDVELRESLKRDNKEFIIPKYNSFYDKYSSLPFTKNPEKYVKYTPDQIASLIDRFFDLAA